VDAVVVVVVLVGVELGAGRVGREGRRPKLGVESAVGRTLSEDMVVVVGGTVAVVLLLEGVPLLLLLLILLLLLLLLLLLELSFDNVVLSVGDLVNWG